MGLRDHEAFWLIDGKPDTAPVPKYQPRPWWHSDHLLTTERIDLHFDSISAMYVATCRCGWKSERPRSYSLIRDEHAAHANGAAL